MISVVGIDGRSRPKCCGKFSARNCARRDEFERQRPVRKYERPGINGGCAAHCFSRWIYQLAVTLFGSGNTNIAARNTGIAARATPIESFPERSVTTPTARGPTRPARFPTELISAMPPAAEYPDRNSLGSVQKGPRALQRPAATRHNRITEDKGEAVAPSSKSDAAPTNAGIAIWYRRSSIRSELWQTATIAASPTRLGIASRSPITVFER